MKSVITSREMRALELNAEYFGISQLQLMENAGKSVANEIAARFDPKKTKVAIFCGLGGNGGDGFVAARHLACRGFKVTVILAGKPSMIKSDAAKKNWQALSFLKHIIQIHEVHDSSLVPDVEAEVVVDALLGIGLKGPPKPPVSHLVRKINELEAFRIAVDVPTGIDSDSGEAFGEAVRANLTVTFHKKKAGLKSAKDFVGDVVVEDIGLPQELERFAGPGDVQLVVKPRPSNSHKGNFGRLLVVGGSDVYSGAPALVAFAALRTGVDIVHVAAPEKTAYAIASMSPNLITIKMEGPNLNKRNVPVIKRYLKDATAAVIGPGLGLHVDTKEAVKELVNLVEEIRIPLLLDADGLKAFADFKRPLKSPLVLTPHAGEYKILTGKKLPQSLDERVKEVKKTAKKLRSTILLKGPVDIISDGKRVKLNFTGNPGMTVGGTGDVLSGIVGAFMAQGANSFEAAVAGAFVNGACGDLVLREKGYHMVPTDLLEWIPKLIDNPMLHAQVQKFE